MFKARQTDQWVFGHWHRSFDGMVEGTRIVRLNELKANALIFDMRDANARLEGPAP